jgi:hypothetical protein
MPSFYFRPLPFSFSSYFFLFATFHYAFAMIRHFMPCCRLAADIRQIRVISVFRAPAIVLPIIFHVFIFDISFSMIFSSAAAAFRAILRHAAFIFADADDS